jgi:hypothetical protein
LNILLFLVTVVAKVLFQVFVDFFKLFLCLSLILGEVVLLLKLVPEFKFTNEVGKHFVCVTESLVEVWIGIDTLHLMLVGVNQELVLVNVLWHADASEDHVNQVLSLCLIETFFQRGKVCQESIVWSYL